MDSIASGENCPKKLMCANFELRCHICKNYSNFVAASPRRKGERAEKAVNALRNKSKLVAGSGSVSGFKGDVSEELCLHEVKYGYGKKSITIQREWLLKIAREAVAEGKIAALDIKFNDSPADELWTLIDSKVFSDMLDELKELRLQLKNKE